ncbi:MAG: NAD(+) synthase [Prevotella sp.]|nr:NAD(+) synthase [Prevotella sp.]MBQ6308651.1 NAD(+) synthase [Prevotella sp.]
MNNSFITVAAAIPAVKVADCDYNIEQIIAQVTEAEEKGVEIIVFPELCVTGYSCQDLFRQSTLLENVELSVVRLLGHMRKMNVIAIIGVPVIVGDLLLNCAAVIQKGSILAMIPKTYLPNYNEFYEKRWFASLQDLRETQIRYAGNKITITPEPLLVRTSENVLFGVEICEDVWAPAPPSNRLALSGADLIFNLSASDELVGKHDYLKGLLAQQSARTITGYIYSGSGFGESTQDVVYGGNAMIYENGVLLEEADRFSLEPQMMIGQIDIERLRSERRTNSTYVNAQRGNNAIIVDALPTDSIPFTLIRKIDPHPFIPASSDMQRSCEEIINIQSCGLAKRVIHTNSKNLVVGISGGLDSTLALLICVNTFDMLHLDRKGIIGVTMPGFGTTDRTYQNALTLMKNLGITIKEINIAKAVNQHFEDIGHDPKIHDVTYENSQARERTQILMDLTNQIGGFVVGTGDLSELALGWATYNGDHMSMYGVNGSVPKTLIRYLVRYIAEYKMDEATKAVLLDIIDTPISPELIPGDEKGNINQKTEDLVGPYELHDFYLYYFLRFGFSPRKIFFLARHAFKGMYDDATIKKWLSTFFRRFFNQQFKRSCLPDGPKVGSVSLSPRGDWRMPSDAVSRLWLKECEEL